MGFGPPTAPAPVADEREMLLSYLRWQRAQVAATAEGLTEEQLRWTPGDRLLPIIGIINHLRLMEWRWIEGRYQGSEFPPRTDEFRVGLDIVITDVLDGYWRQAGRTEEVVRSAHDLDVHCLGDEHGRGPAHKLLGFERPVNLRWVLLHVLEETSHHAGQADSTRELIDGTRMRD